MKIQIRNLNFFTGFAILSLTIFLLGGFLIFRLSAKEENLSSGRVLGADAEAKINESGISRSFYSFPLNENNELKPPQKKADFNNVQSEAQRIAVYDSRSGSMIYDQKGDEKSSIASITKLMTALVFLETDPDWEKIYEVKKEDLAEGGRAYIFIGEKLKVKDLFYLCLVGSVNTAANALVSSTGLTQEQFVAAMNEKARKLGLLNTNFVEPIGLDSRNVSTASEIAKLAQIAMSNQFVSDALLTLEYQFTTQDNQTRIIYNTDDLLNNFNEDKLKIFGGKTGYNDTAGYCFVGKFSNPKGDEIVVSVLGAPSKDARFTEAEKIAQWTYDSFLW